MSEILDWLANSITATSPGAWFAVGWICKDVWMTHISPKITKSINNKLDGNWG